MILPQILWLVGGLLMVAAAIWAIRLFTEAREEVRRLNRLNEHMHKRSEP